MSTTLRSSLFTGRSAGWLAVCFLALVTPAAAQTPATPEIPLTVGHRIVHVFRTPLGAQSAAERAAAAEKHITTALAAEGEGWTSTTPTANGVVVSLDNQPMFVVLPGDARTEEGETTELLANRASKVLQKVWTESRELRQSGVNRLAILKVLAALAVLVLVLVSLSWVAGILRRGIARRLVRQLADLPAARLRARLADVLLRFLATLSTALFWLLGLMAIVSTLSYVFAQFILTRPLSENLIETSRALLTEVLRAGAAALPGLVVAVVIFGLARIVTQISKALFDHIAAGHFHWGALDAHTAPPTRYLVNAAIWLFAVAMAYPYLPGSHTEAFRGLTVLLGLMVSIGAAGPVGQIASGLILAYTRALLIGDYVRIQEREGTVIHLGLCVTRLRTGTGEEIALPNSVVMGNVTQNFSRHAASQSCIVETTVTIGYDTPWRQVHALLLEAAATIPALRQDPAPFVVQTALSDFYVNYRVVAQAANDASVNRLQVVGSLNAAIQDVFARHQVQIMSPHYFGDPGAPKIPRKE